MARLRRGTLLHTHALRQGEGNVKLLQPHEGVSKSRPVLGVDSFPLPSSRRSIYTHPISMLAPHR